MRKQITVISILGLLLCFAVPAAHAQAKCTLQTMMGTYAFYERGQSTFVDLSGSVLKPPATPPFWNATTAPFITLGEITFAPNGVGEGFYWIRIGLLNGGSDPIPVKTTVTEMNPDCTGKVTYAVNLPGISATITERFIVFDDGREFRTVPTTLENAVPGLAWFGVFHRIRKPGDAVPSCGPQTARGTYLVSAENVITFDGQTGVADALLLHYNVSMTGDYTGTLYERAAAVPQPIQLPISGNVTVNPDCSFSQVLNVETIGTVNIRGVFFNEGKKSYAMAVDDIATSGIMYSFAPGERTEHTEIEQ